jgi:hypothetical protein
MTHQESLNLLPWYATLDDKQRREMDLHIKGCSECARDLAEIQSMRATIAPLEEVPEPSPFLLQRALARIDEYEREKAETRAGSRFWNWWRLAPHTARVLIAVQALLVFGLGVGVLYYQQRAEEYETLAGKQPAATGSRIRVAFQSGVSEEALRETIRSVNGIVVDGPSALGIYTLRIPEGSEVDKVVAELAANTRVIRFAQKEPD